MTLHHVPAQLLVGLTKAVCCWAVLLLAGWSGGTAQGGDGISSRVDASSDDPGRAMSRGATLRELAREDLEALPLRGSGRAPKRGQGMTGEALAMSKESGAHRLLGQMVGEWEGTAKTWLEPGKLGDESPNTGTIRAALDGMFIVHGCKSRMQGRSLTGMAIFGYFLAEKKWQMAWVDTFHMETGILLSEAQAGETVGKKFSVLGRYGGASGPAWGWRTELELTDANHLVITHYNITPQGQEAKAVEVRYARKRR